MSEPANATEQPAAQLAKDETPESAAPLVKKKKKKKRYKRIKPKIPKEVLDVIGQRQKSSRFEEVQEKGKRSRRSNRLALEWARKIEQQRSLNAKHKNKFSRNKNKGPVAQSSALLRLNADYEAETRQKQDQKQATSKQTKQTNSAQTLSASSNQSSSQSPAIPGGSAHADVNLPSASGTGERQESHRSTPAGSATSIRSPSNAEPTESLANDERLEERLEPPAGAVVAGWLTKKPIGVGLTKLIGFSQKRWFRLDGPMLTYCEDSDPNSPKAKTLRLTGQSEITVNRQKLTFYLVANPTRSKETRLAKLTAQAETEMQLDRWVKALGKTIRGLKTVDFCGWLLKQPSGNKRFGYAQTRWFALRGNKITYSEIEFGPPKGELLLSEYSRVEAAAKVGVINRKAQNGFTIFASKVVVASAPSTIVRDAWIAYIQRAIDVLADPSLANQEFHFPIGSAEDDTDELPGDNTGARSKSVSYVSTASNRSSMSSVGSAAPTPPPRNKRRQLIRNALDINNPVVVNASRRGGLASAGGSVRDILAAGRNMSSRHMPRWVMDEIDAEEAEERDGVPAEVLLAKENMLEDEEGEGDVVAGDGDAKSDVSAVIAELDDEEDGDSDADEAEGSTPTANEDGGSVKTASQDGDDDDDDAVEEALIKDVLARTTGRMSRALASDKFVTVLDSLEAQKALKLRNRMVLEVCAELLETEETYVKDLATVIELFVKPLKKIASKNPRRAILSQRDIEVLFKDIEVIHQVNEALLETLRGGLQQFKRLQRDVPLREIGEIFLSMIPYMRAYGPYCSNFPFAQQKLEYCEATVPGFSKYLSSFSSHERCQNLKLRDFLIKPVQRMCKYPLFLKEMLKYSDKAHPDFRYIKVAGDELSSLTGEIETSMTEAIAAAQMYQIFLRLCDPFKKQLITPSRKFISEQSLFLIYPRAYGMLAQAPKGRLSVAAPPSGYGHGRKSQVITSHEKEQSPGGVALASGRSSTGVHIGYGVEWERNSLHPRCTACGRKFSMMVRRHHCRMCGTVVCADCSKARVEMATVEGRTNSKKQRNSAPGLTLDAAKSGDIVTGEHVEKERVCVSCTDLLLRSEAFLSQTTKPGGSSLNGYSPDHEKLQHLVDSAMHTNASGTGDSSVAVRLLIFSDLVIVARPMTVDNEIDVASTTVPLAIELPPFQIDTVVVKPIVEDGKYYVCLGLPSQEQLGGNAGARAKLLETRDQRASLFSLSFKIRCCDQQQMDFVADSITEAAQLYIEEIASLEKK